MGLQLLRLDFFQFAFHFFNNLFVVKFLLRTMVVSSLKVGKSNFFDNIIWLKVIISILVEIFMTSTFNALPFFILEHTTLVFFIWTFKTFRMASHLILAIDANRWIPSTRRFMFKFLNCYLFCEILVVSDFFFSRLNQIQCVLQFYLLGWLNFDLILKD